MHTCDLSTPETEAGKLQGQRQPGPSTKTLSQETKIKTNKYIKQARLTRMGIAVYECYLDYLDYMLGD